MLAVLEVFQLSGQENASSLAVGLWFYYVRSAFSFGFGVEVSSELGVLQREHPGQWEEVVLIWKVVPEIH
jgi:hypothetical protein